MTPQVLILGYHKIGPIPKGGWASWYYVPTQDFAAQLRWLKEEGYAYLTLADFLRGIDDPSSLPPKSVFITFDDGYSSILRHGFPEMQAAGCPGVIFMPTQYIGGFNAFDEWEEPHEEILSWEQMAELERNGVAIQSHGITHRPFSGLSPREWDQEIAESKAVLEKGLHRPIELFSFPYGDAGVNPGDIEAIQQLLRKHGYRAACRYGADPLPFGEKHRFELGRLGIGSDTDFPAAVESFWKHGQA